MWFSASAVAALAVPPVGTSFRLDDDDPRLPNELVSKFSKRPTMEPSDPNDGGSSTVDPYSAAMFFAPGASGVVADVGVEDAVDDTFEALLLQYSANTPVVAVLAFFDVVPTPLIDGDLDSPTVPCIVVGVAALLFVTAVPDVTTAGVVDG